MKKYFLLFISVVTVLTIQAQNKPSASKTNIDTAKQLVHVPSVMAPKKDWSKVDFSKRANDHLMIQIGADDWLNHPGWMNIKSGRHFNFYLMMDKPFKSNPHYSSSYGIGITCNNIFFNNQTLDISNASPDTVTYINTANSNHFSKFKLTTMYLTLPVEIRYFSNPVNPNKSWKLAAGAKVGLLINSYTKGKDLLDNTGASIYGTSYTKKEYDSKFFNSYLFSLTARAGWGNFSLNADYHLTNVYKDGFGTAVHPFSIGLTISGL